MPGWVGLMLIAVMKDALGDLDRVGDIVKVLGNGQRGARFSPTIRRSSTAARISSSRYSASAAGMPARRSA